MRRLITRAHVVRVEVTRLREQVAVTMGGVQSLFSVEEAMVVAEAIREMAEEVRRG